MVELAILGGLFLTGYNMAQSGKSQRYEPSWKAPPKDANRYPWAAPDDSLQRQARGMYDARFQASLDPRQTGIIAPNFRDQYDLDQADLARSVLQGDWANKGTGYQPLPYFTSGRSQGTNEAGKQQRMEMFTGAVDACSSQTGAWKAKREQAPAFAPAESAQAVTSDGRIGNPVMVEDDSRFYVSGIQNNTGPTDRIQVGPGLNVPLDVAATGGFHPYFRILPKNVDGYRKNNLPMRAVPGASYVQSRAAPLPMDNRKQSLVYTMEQRPLAPGMATVTGTTARDNYEARGVERHHENYSGGAGTTVPGAQLGNGAWVRNRPDTRGFAPPVLNVGAQGAAVGAYATTTFDPTPYQTTNREDGMPSGAPFGQEGVGGYTVSGTQSRPTFREATERTPETITLSNPRVAAPPTSQQGPRTTGRQLLNEPGWMAAPGSRVQAHERRGFASGQESNQLNPLKSQTVVGYTPGGGGTGLGNSFQSDVGSVNMRSDLHTERPGNSQAGTIYYGKPGTETGPRNKLPETGYYVTPADLSLAKDQLKDNPYALSII